MYTHEHVNKAYIQNMYSYTHIHIYTHTYTQTHTHTYICMYVYTHTHIYTHTHTHTHTHIYIYMYVCMQPTHCPVGRVFANAPGDLGSIQVESYQRLLKQWYLIPRCLTFSIIRYVSRVKWSNPGKRVVPSPTPRCSSY